MKPPVAGSTVPEYVPGGPEGHSCLGEVKEDDVIRVGGGRAVKSTAGALTSPRTMVRSRTDSQDALRFMSTPWVPRTGCVAAVPLGRSRKPKWSAAARYHARESTHSPFPSAPPGKRKRNPPGNLRWPYLSTRPVAARTLVPGESPWASTRGVRARATRSRTRTNVVLAARSSPFITPMAAAAQ